MNLRTIILTQLACEVLLTYFALSILKIQLSDGELALGSPAFFLFFSLSTVNCHNSYN